MLKIPVHQIILSDRNDISSKSVPQTETIQKFFDKNKFEHKVWTNDSVVDHIRQYFHPSVLMAYNSLIPKAYKADLARYCILYVYGGWYIDATITINDIPPEMKYHDMFLVKDMYSASYGSPWAIANGLIYSVPGHQIFKIMIDKIVKNCKTKTYGKKSLSVSGPELFGRVIAEYGYDNPNTNYYLGNFAYDKTKKRKIFFYENVEFGIAKTLDGGVTKIPGGNNYVEAWENKKVFGPFKL